MWPNPQFPADLVTFPEDILNGELHFLCSDSSVVRVHSLITLNAFNLQKRPPEVFCKKGIIKKYRKIHMFSYDFCEIFKDTFFIEHLWWLLLNLMF